MTFYEWEEKTGRDSAGRLPGPRKGGQYYTYLAGGFISVESEFPFAPGLWSVAFLS